MRRIVFLTGCIIIFVTLLSAQEQKKPCSAPEFSQFDFGIGEWGLSWSDSLHGSNSMTKEYNDCVIYERFDGNPGVKFRGMSVSTYNINTKKWHQT